MAGMEMKAELLVRFEGADQPIAIGSFTVPFKMDFADGMVSCTPDFSGLHGLAAQIAAASAEES